ncbi:CidA/LrgA family protein [Lactobacillus selangorensis]|uniref:CidA/LrgA family protein n=1 Tax=Lactobacillus selangorensis TaxID=81857 RepID=UPI000708DBF1|nr:CidA/LrgA family protein [Lactobacillus selangorensis]
MQKDAPLWHQLFIYTVLIGISDLISRLLERLIPSFPFPTALVGLILMYVLLEMQVLKLPQVERLGNFLLKYISLFFIPSGISLVTALPEMKSNGLAIVFVVIFSTVFMLVLTAAITWGLLKFKAWRNNSEAEEETD